MNNADRVLIIEFQEKYSDSGDNEIARGTDYLFERAMRVMAGLRGFLFGPL